MICLCEIVKDGFFFLLFPINARSVNVLLMRLVIPQDKKFSFATPVECYELPDIIKSKKKKKKKLCGRYTSFLFLYYFFFFFFF